LVSDSPAATRRRSRMSPKEAAWIGELVRTLQVKPGSKVTLPADFDPASTADFVEKKESTRLLAKSVELLAAYQDRLAAENAHAVLLCLQALDAAGKDGTIRHVMSGVNPQGVHVSSFKVPSSEELDHDYLWRYAHRLPARGEIGIFNRSHYEEVLVVRVHPELLERQHLPPEAVGPDLWKRRFAEMNDWEHYLTDNGIRIVKVFLNISKDEQRRRFLRRLELPDHNWKFSASDIRERRYWDDYQHAFSDMLSHTSTKWSPWYVVPADHKWFARICVGAILGQALMELDPRYPEITPGQRREELAAREALLAETPADGAASA
jgi:PPK2 family polyphosphate:nucleotide phosphotransferase